MAAEAATLFTWPDYLVMGIMLLLSAGIGFYYAFTGGKQKTTREYLMADQNMHWFPVSCSLLAGFISSSALLGLPGEIYSFGTVFLLSYIFKPIGVVLALVLFLPIFKRLKIISVYEYIEMRYGKVLKYIMLVTGLINWLLYATLTIYGPALSISVVTGMNIWLAILSVALVGILYTVIGGLKAVVWADTLQLVVMVFGVIFIITYGSIQGGGFQEILEVNKLSGRMDILEPSKYLDFDPRVRHTLWGLGVHGIIFLMTAYGYTPQSTQRAIALKSNKDMIIAYSVCAIGTIMFGVLCSMLGLVIFAHNRYCDPVKNGDVFTKDQLYPLYVMQVFGHLPGLPGFVLSSVFCASLSTVSSVLNSGAAILLSDCVKPFRPHMSDRSATMISKILSLLLGVVSVILTVFARYFGTSLLSMGLTFGGIFGGSMFATFTMGIFMPVINNRGAIIGYIVGSLYAAWLGFGRLVHKPYVYEYPVSTEGCNITDADALSNLTSPVYDPSSWDIKSHYRSGVEALYDISYLWVGAGGSLVTLIVAFVFSLILGKSDDKLIDRKLLSPLLFHGCCWIPNRWKRLIDMGSNLTQQRDTEKIDRTESMSSEPKDGKINLALETDEDSVHQYNIKSSEETTSSTSHHVDDNEESMSSRL